MLPGDGTQHASAYRNGVNGNLATGGGGVSMRNGVGVQALGEDLSQLDLGETGPDGRKQGSGADARANGLNVGMERGGTAGTGGVGAGGTVMGQGMSYDMQGRQQGQEQLLQSHEHRNRPRYPQSVRDMEGRVHDGVGHGGGGGGHKRSTGPTGSKGSSGEWGAGRRPTAAEAAELLRRR